MDEKKKKVKTSVEGVDVVGDEGEVTGLVVDLGKQVFSKMSRPSTKTRSQSKFVDDHAQVIKEVMVMHDQNIHMDMKAIKIQKEI
ncbi:hypothetical protein SUGI_0788250 [Cryptomeria japonica]|nr:hypothetical protein SUGI_0788250 [Cryptomeria japonica]